MSSKKIRKSGKKYCPLGNRIQRLQEINDLKAYELALMLGISTSYLSDIKYGRSGVTGFKFWDAIRRKMPEWEYYLKGKAKNPEKRTNLIRIYDDEGKPVSIMPKAHVKYKIETGGPAGQAIEPEGVYEIPSKWYHETLDNILNSGDMEIIQAVQSVLVACKAKTIEKDQLDSRIQNLEQVIMEQKPPSGTKERRSIWKDFKELLQRGNEPGIVKHD